MDTPNTSIWDAIKRFLVSLIPQPAQGKRRRIDTRRLAPVFVIGLFIVVTISHEASYAGSFEKEGYEFVGWPYAIAMNLSILIAEYFTRWTTTRTWAWRAFYIVAIGSGLMNVAYIRPWELDGMDELFAWIYAILPTVIIIFLGFLSSSVGKLAGAQEARWKTQDEKADAFPCFCGKSFAGKRSLDAHTKTHANELRRERDSGTFDNVAGALRFLKDKYEADDELYPSAVSITRWIKE